jgi:TP901 family phage tail tape measure protein
VATLNEKAVVDLVVNGKQAEVPLVNIAKAATNAKKALDRMAETDPGYAKQKALWEQLARAQQARIVRINQEKTAWERFKAGTGNVMAGVVGGNLVSQGLDRILGMGPKIIATYREFNAASKELSAVTGLVGKDLEYLEKQASRTGPAVGKSGAEMLEAYKLMASAKPELLEQKELLAETTKAAITLAQAGKIDLAEATKVTAESLNQFGEGADQANRYINVIAAGAKEGSAEINEMGAALKNSGTVAAAQGVSFEQTNAVLQSLSTIALKGGEAGTQLKNVILTLGSGSDETNPKVVGLETALDNLGKKNLSTAQMTKLFGKENITAAQHIIAHRGEIAELTNKLTGTQEAFIQAKKNNESLDHQLEVFWARMEGIAVLIGTKVIPAFTGFLDVAMSAAKFLTGALTPASEEATQAFEDQRATVQGLQRNLLPLLARHDELKKKTTLTKDEQAELKKVVGQIAEVVPSAATGFDKYGNALDINTDKARKFIEVQQQLLKYANRDAIDENRLSLTSLEKQQKQQQDLLNSGGKQVFRTLLGNGQVVERVIMMSQEQLTDLRAQLQATTAEIDDKKKLLSGLTGDYMNQPTAPAAAPTKPAATTGGGGSGETDEAKRKRLAVVQANREAKLAIEEMDVKAIADEKERELAMVKFRSSQEKEQIKKSLANAGLKATWMKGVDTALKAEQLRIEEKYTEKQFQQEQKRLANVLKTAENELLIIRSSELAKVKARVQAGGITKEQGQAEELKVEQQFLFAKEVLYASHYDTLRERAGDNAETLEQINEAAAAELNAIAADQLSVEGDITTQRIDLRNEDLKHAEHVHQEKMRFAKEERAFQRQMIQDMTGLLANDWTSTLQGYRDYWRGATLIQKAALIAQKSYALAEIGIQLARQLALINTAAAVADAFAPGAGIAIRVKGYAMSIGSAAISTAKVLAAGASTPAFANGGFTDEDPEGFTNGATYYRKRNFIAGEAGQEWIMSNPMLKTPMMANLAGAMQSLQQSGEYRNSAKAMGVIQQALGLGAGMSAGTTGGSAAGGGQEAYLAQMIMELQQTRQEMKRYADRPINNNYFKVREVADRVDYIDTVTKL